MDDTTRLARSAATGDRAALSAFVRRTQPEVWRLCAHLADRDEADDLTQETFERALRSLPSFRADSSARTWLLQIARNTCADHLRRRGRRRRLVDRLGRGSGDDGLSPARTGEVDLDDSLTRLEPDRRAAFVLTQVLGLSYAAAADVCGCPIGTIRSRVARAREDLVAGLADGAASTG
jgi:RNA polymerase sigma-70 factor (ECF subfamily)